MGGLSKFSAGDLIPKTTQNRSVDRDEGCPDQNSHARKPNQLNFLKKSYSIEQSLNAAPPKKFFNVKKPIFNANPQAMMAKGPNPANKL
jgi:hypothetical protein